MRSPAPRVSTTSPGPRQRSAWPRRRPGAGRYVTAVRMRVEHRAQDEAARHAGPRRLAGRVHVGEHDRVGVDERVGEVAPQAGRPRVAVGLEHRDDRCHPPLARRAERGPHLAREVRVVVDEGDAVDLAPELEPAGHATERRRAHVPWRRRGRRARAASAAAPTAFAALWRPGTGSSNTPSGPPSRRELEAAAVATARRSRRCGSRRRRASRRCASRTPRPRAPRRSGRRRRPPGRRGRAARNWSNARDERVERRRSGRGGRARRW